uniref:Arsenite methyltransferase n=1 Tax=Magnetococcus massalia (strain MO-1) TaxID=451514 RepID=A0A1S7LDI6_MAGMO|nr:putative type 11 Methyltransferase [Candidatus Magnetococcus massalia]
MIVQQEVSRRFADGAQKVEPELCCPVDYDQDLLAILPKEIIERDYGCGDPSRYVQPGDHVLDLGSGGGKICYMAAQLVGQGGRVTGVDMTDEMLALARSYQAEMAEKLGEDRVRFVKGRIQDLAQDVERLEDHLKANPVQDLASMEAFDRWQQQQRHEQPMIADGSIDLVVSNCVLNLVEDGSKQQMVEEIYRVLRPGGRVAISDIVSDAPIPQSLKDNPELWSGCISGAFEEEAFAEAFREAGFVGVTLDKWDEKPWQVVEGIEFRSVTLLAYKPALFDPTDQGHAVIYRGPFLHVTDERGNIYPAGERIAVSSDTFDLLGREPYAAHFIRIPPGQPVFPQPFTLEPGTRRPVEVSRGSGQKSAPGKPLLSIQPAGGSCTPGGSCC